LATRLLPFLLLILLAGCATTQPVGTPPRQPVVVGYVPAFRGFDEIVERADFSPYTHINIAFVNPAPDGSLVAGDAMACMSGGAAPVGVQAFRRSVERIRASGAKALISLGGGVIPACSADWATLLRPETRGTVVRNLLALVDTYGLDGIDVDIEGVLLTRIDNEGNYTPFIAELGAALRERGKLLTCATASYEGGMIPVNSIPWFDLVNVMSYDAIGPTWGAAADEHSTYAQAERDLALWRARGVPRERLVLGIPFYGYGFGSYRATYDIREIAAEFGEDAVRQDVIGHRCAGCSYITYNGLPTLSRKVDLAREQGAGIMVWEITQDTSENRFIRALRSRLSASPVDNRQAEAAH